MSGRALVRLSGGPRLRPPVGVTPRAAPPHAWDMLAAGGARVQVGVRWLGCPHHRAGEQAGETVLALAGVGATHHPGAARLAKAPAAQPAALEGREWGAALGAGQPSGGFCR